MSEAMQFGTLVFVIVCLIASCWITRKDNTGDREKWNVRR